MGPQEEKERYLRMLAADPSSQAFAPLAEAQRKLGELEEAKKVCLDGLQRHPNYPTGRAIFGHILIDLEEFEAAKKELARAVQLAPDNIMALKNLALCHAKTGDQNKARSLFERVLSDNPEDPEAKEFLKNQGGHGSATASSDKPVKDEYQVRPASQAFAPLDEQQQSTDQSEHNIQTETVAKLYLEQGHPQKALKVVASLIEAEGPKPSLMALLAEVTGALSDNLTAAATAAEPVTTEQPVLAAELAADNSKVQGVALLETFLRRVKVRKRG